jgi:hypothetical protein
MSQTPPEGLPEDMPPPPGGPEDIGLPAEPAAPVAGSGDNPLGRRQAAFWSRIGGAGLMASLLFHGTLLLFFAAWVIVTITDEAKTDPDTFATGAGGGSKGDRAVIRDHKVTPRNAQNIARSSARITSKSSTAAVSLPDLPTTSVSSLLTGMTAGAASKGFGGGSGGGIGSGQGVGVGNARNFVGKPVMGARIVATRIAVYLDASGSMRGYLPRVEEEIRRQFPEADIFRYNGAWVNVIDGEVVGGRQNRPNNRSFSPPQDPSSFSTDPKTLTTDGRQVYRRWDENFRAGSVGAWLDVMMREKSYDALVVFSDFQDGITQRDKAGEVIFQERMDRTGSSGRNVVSANNRRRNDERWEQDWINVFTRAQSGQGPRLYCFTTQVEPQKLLATCVEVSGGDIKNVSWLRDPNARPPAATDPSAPPATAVAPTQGQPYRPPR